MEVFTLTRKTETKTLFIAFTSHDVTQRAKATFLKKWARGEKEAKDLQYIYLISPLFA